MFLPRKLSVKDSLSLPPDAQVFFLIVDLSQRADNPPNTRISFYRGDWTSPFCFLFAFGPLPLRCSSSGLLALRAILHDLPPPSFGIQLGWFAASAPTKLEYTFFLFSW